MRCVANECNSGRAECDRPECQGADSEALPWIIVGFVTLICTILAIAHFALK